MNTDIKVSLTIRGNPTIAVGREIGSLYEHLKPIAYTDHSLGVLAGGVMNAEYIKRVKLRKDAAQKISEHLTDAIMEILRSMDTVNGYEVVADKDNLQKLINLGNFA